nr:hypothetical protein [Tanacetum cinerariifolium]
MDEFALHINPQQEGNMNRWIEADVPLLGKMDEPLKDEEEDPEEEEMEEEEMVNDEDDGDNKEDDAEIADADDVPIPHSVHKGVKRLSKQMHDMYRTERKMAGKLRQDELQMNGQEEFTELKIQNRKAEELSRWEAWVRGRIPNNLLFQEEPFIDTTSVPRDDDPYVIVRDAVMVTQEDEDDDPNAP